MFNLFDEIYLLLLKKYAVSAFQKTRFGAIYEAKWGLFKVTYSTLKVLPLSWTSSSKQI